MKIFPIKTFLSIIFVFAQALNAQEVLDKIVAVVDNEYILKSELDFQTQLTAYQRKLNPNDLNLRKSILNAMIEEKLILAQAEIDSITASEDEINRQLNYQIDLFIQQFGSKEKFEQAYNRPLEKIKRELRDEVKKNILIQKVQEQRLARIETSRYEVEEFFNLYKDSLGTIPEEYKLSQIFISPKLSGSDKKIFRDRIELLLDSIKNGGDFAEFAKRYSEDAATAKGGGDLGFVKRGLFFKEFEEAVFTLKEGEISNVIETPLGYHIVQLLDRRGESVHARHILIKVQKSKTMDERVISFLNSIADSCRNGFGTFAEYAQKYSEDRTSAQFGGDMGFLSANELENEMRTFISKMEEGEISEPRRINLSQTDYGYQIILLEKRIPEHNPNLEQDFEKLQQLTLMKKKQSIYADWIAQLKKQVYWEIRL